MEKAPKKYPSLKEVSLATLTLSDCLSMTLWMTWTIGGTSNVIYFSVQGNSFKSKGESDENKVKTPPSHQQVSLLPSALSKIKSFLSTLTDRFYKKHFLNDWISMRKNWPPTPHWESSNQKGEFASRLNTVTRSHPLHAIWSVEEEENIVSLSS